jgi:hypothetical protein
MKNIFIIGGIISLIFFIVKFIESRFTITSSNSEEEKELKGLKYIFRDALLVYFSVICGHFIIDQVNILISKESGIINEPKVFVGNPEF